MESAVHPLMQTASDIVDGDASKQSPTILVVEDDALVRRVVVEHLRDCGFLVIEAGKITIVGARYDLDTDRVAMLIK